LPEGCERSPLLGDGVHGVGKIVHVRARDPRHRDTTVLATAAVAIIKYCTVEVPNSQRISCLGSSLGKASACSAGGRRFAPRP
jgi:hypothetical protein